MTADSPRPDARRWWALAALAVSVLTVVLDLFVLSLALPTLSADLHASSSDLQWFVDSYSLALAAALLPAGLLGDRFGRKKMLTGALAMFGVSSLACAYSRSAGELIAARTALGLAAAVILPMSLAVIPVLFSDQERPRAIAIVGGATFIGYPIGPILGGWLLDHFWWGSVFLINVPVVLIALAAVAVLMPESRSAARPRLDVIGVAISSIGLMAVTYGVIRAGQDGWSDTLAIAMMAAGAVTLAGFAAWERALSRRARGRVLPLVDLTLFASAGFTWGTILATLVSFALFGLVFAMPQYFLDVRGLDSLASGVRMLPMIGGLAAGLAIGQRLLTPRKTAEGEPPGPPRVAAKLLAATGFTIMAAALAAGTATTVATGSGYAATWFAVTGLGLGIAMPTALNAALGALSPERSGSGSALITAMRQVGGTIGVAVLGTVLATAYQSHLSLAGLPPAAAAAVRGSVVGGIAVARKAGSAALLAMVRTGYVDGLDIMLWVCAGIALAAAALALAFLPGRADSAPAADAAGAAGATGMGAGPVPAGAGGPEAAQTSQPAAPGEAAAGGAVPGAPARAE
ncbi:MAG: MFS transporter [Streptosporangiaceae bacterium]